MPQPHSLTVVIVAKNEARNIQDCVRSASFADDVLVLDSNSTDATVQLAREAGARVITTDWPGYGPQVARGFALAKTDWVLSLDADERITQALRDEIVAAIHAPQHAGYRIPRLSEFCGRFIHHSGWRPDHTLRLGRRDKSGFTDHFLHAHMTVEGSVADLHSPLIHFSYPDLHDVLEKLDRYSSGHARDMLVRGKRGGLGKAVVHGVMAFFRTYLLRLGFLDGQRGLMLAIYNAEYTYYKYLKLMFLQSPVRRPEFPRLMESTDTAAPTVTPLPGSTGRAAPPVPGLRQRIRRMWPYFAGGRAGVLLVVAGALVGALTEPAIPALMQPLLDSGFKNSTLPLWLVPLAVIGLFAVRSAAGFVAQYGLARTANLGMQNLRRAMFERLLDAAPSLFTESSASSLTNTLTYEVQTGTYQLVYSLLTLVRDSLMVVAMLGYLLWLNWQLTIFVAVMIPAIAFVMRSLSKRMHRLTVAAQSVTDELAYVVEENVLAWRIVRLHGAKAMQARRFGAISDALRRLSIKSAVAGASTTPFTQMLAAFALSAVIVAALWQSQHGNASVGSFVSFVVGMLMLIGPMKHLSEVAGPITRGLAALERGIALIEDSATERGGSHDPGRAAGHLQLQGVSLRYPGSGQPALNDIDVELRPGETVALVGPSGAGKSTLVNLLPRFIEPSSGRLLLDGLPLADWDMNALRRQFALVSQDVILFNDSIAANVALGAEVHSDDAAGLAAVRERVLRALQGANLMDHVNSLPLGIATVIGHNGNQLSGGQRQRLAIARAIYKDAPVLILDEATSALDSESERLVQQALETLMRGRTSLVIAHRLSTIERADRIIAMQEGRVVEQGSHAELLAHGGLYARLHALQFGGHAA